MALDPADIAPLSLLLDLMDPLGPHSHELYATEISAA